MIIDDRMSTDIEIKSNDGCTPRNALFCCHSPVCLNGPKILPIDYQTNRQPDVIPVSVPDLSKLGVMNVSNQRDVNKTGELAPTTGGKVPTSALQQDARLGVVLRRVTPPRKTVMVKKSDPMMGVVLRKVDKHTLTIPKPRPAERSPPPKKASAKNQPVANKVSPKHPVTPVIVAPPVVAIPVPILPPPPVNLLKNRPPLEIHRIEGDKIIIIRRIPKANPTAGQDKTHSSGHGGHGGNKHSDISKTHSGHKSHKHHSGHGKLKSSAALSNGTSTQVTFSLCRFRFFFPFLMFDFLF